jgi:hypothetical protein
MTTLLDSEIKYSRDTKDYDILICGQYVGSASTYSQAETIRTHALAERRDEGLYATATELDGGAVPPGTDADDFSDVDGEGRSGGVWAGVGVR